MTIIYDDGQFWIEQINGSVTTTIANTQADGSLVPLTRGGHVMAIAISNAGNNLVESFIFGAKMQDGSSFVLGKMITGIIPTAISQVPGTRAGSYLLFMRS